MSATKVAEDIELIIDDIGNGGGNPPPVLPHGGGGDGDAHKKGQPPSPAQRPYHTAIILGMVSITMFFMALAAAFLVRKMGKDWVPVQIPVMVWINTVVLLASSGTTELSRRRLGNGDTKGFRAYWRVTTALGFLFVLGQIVAWRELVDLGFYVGSNPASSFFYVFTAAHGLHLLGGIGALLYVLFRNFDKTKLTRDVAVEITSHYWHFMDGLWLFLLALLYFGR
jgi:cytochrome c oxidase subunit III